VFTYGLDDIFFVVILTAIIIAFIVVKIFKVLNMYVIRSKIK